MTTLFKKISEAESFQRFILFLIIVTAMAMGVEAVPSLADTYGDMLYTLDCVIQAIFVVEIAIRLLAHAPKFSGFFRERWNTFDLLIVILSLVPAIGSFALVARLFRILRILRAFSASDNMRAFAGRLQKTCDEIAGSVVIVAVLGYVFIVSGHYLFADMDPAHWGDLKQALLSVFYLLLLQDVPAFVEPLVAKSLWALSFFGVFYTVFIGLFISVITAAVTQDKDA